eukprot:360959_1
MTAQTEKKYNNNNADSAAYSGYLYKQSLHLKQFRLRWIVLSGNELCSYKNAQQNLQSLTEIIDLNKFEWIKALNNNNNNTFELISNNPKISKRVFRTQEIEDRKKWINKIINITKIKQINNININNDIIKLNIQIEGYADFDINDTFTI